MAQYNAIKAAVNAYIKANGRKEITGQILNSVLNATIDSLGRFFQFAGEARPDTDPGNPDQNVTYLAGVPGTYTHFNGLVIDEQEIALLMWNGDWVKHTMLIGIREVVASVDDQVGTPSVDVNYDNAELSLAFHNMKGNPGKDGNDGAAAGFGSVTADVDANIGTPGVSVATSGSNTAKNFTFHFTNLKGQKGDTGVTSVNVSVDNNTGVPSATASLSGGVLTLTFHNLKGQQGDTGSSVDYPYTLVNNVTTNDATQGLSAAMGVYLQSEIDQLEGAFDIETSYNLFDKSQPLNDGYINSSGAIGGNSSYKYSYAIPVTPGHYYLLSGRNLPTSTNVRCLDASNNPLKVLIASTGTEYSSWMLPKENGSGGTANGQFKVPADAVSFQFNAVWGGDGDVNSVMLIDLGTTYTANPPTPAYKAFGTIVNLKYQALPSALKAEVEDLDQRADALEDDVFGINETRSHEFTGAETYYYFDGLDIKQGDKFRIVLGGTATWNNYGAWLVSDASGAVSPGLGLVLPNASVDLVASADTTKIGIRVYTLATTGTITMQLKTEGEVKRAVGTLSDLETSNKTNIVSAINEVNGKVNIADYVQTINLFDKSAIVPGYVKLSDGSLAGQTDGYSSSAPIPVTPGHYYYLSGRVASSYGIRCLDSSNNPLKVRSAGNNQEFSDYRLPNDDASGAKQNGQFKIPSGAVSVQFTVRFNDSASVDDIMLIDLGTSYIKAPYIPPVTIPYGTKPVVKPSALPPEIISSIKGKKIRIFGGSVADYCRRFGGVQIMSDLLGGATIVDSAVSGAGYCKGTEIVEGQPVFAANSIPDQVNTATAVGQAKYEIYVLWSSTNDNSYEVGDATDYTYFDSYDVNKLTKMSGGLNYCIKKLLDFNPEARVIVLGSMKWFNGGANFGTTMNLMMEGQRKVAALQSCPFFSLWENAGVNFANKDTYFTWTVDVEGESRNDGTHPNAWAYRNVLAPKIAKQLALLY